MVLFWWLLVSANVAACHMLRAFVANYMGNRTFGSCIPQWQEEVCRIFNGQGDVERHSHLHEHRKILKEPCGAMSPGEGSN